MNWDKRRMVISLHKEYNTVTIFDSKGGMWYFERLSKDMLPSYAMDKLIGLTYEWNVDFRGGLSIITDDSDKSKDAEEFLNSLYSILYDMYLEEVSD